MCLCELSALILWCWWLVNDSQVRVIRIPVIGIADWWKSLVYPWQNPPLHSPLLRAENPDVMEGDLDHVALDLVDEKRGTLPRDWDRVCHLLGPMIFPLGHTPPSPPDIPVYTHDVGNSGSPLQSRPFHPPALSGEGGSSTGPGTMETGETGEW